MTRVKSKAARSKSDKPKKNAGGVKKAAEKTKIRYRQHTITARKMRELGRKTDLVFYKGPFDRMIDAELANVVSKIKGVDKILIKKQARRLIQTSVEDYVGLLYAQANEIAGEAGGKQRVMLSHIEIADRHQKQ